MLVQINSGGQTGADQAAWRVAKAFGVRSGGRMPEVFPTADGPRPEFADGYAATEDASSILLTTFVPAS